MKILAVVGSPRKGGNTDILVERVIQGAEEAGALVERVFLADLDIAPCDGCGSCKHSGICVLDDDMTPLYEKLLESDGWVLGTPVYCWGPSAQMKAFIDRWYAFCHDAYRWRVKGKWAVLVSPFADESPSTTAYLEGMLTELFNFLEMEFVGKVTVPSVSEKGEVLGHPAALDQAYKMGKVIGG